MAISLQPVVGGEYPRLTAGNINELSGILYNELVMSGYSLLLEDVEGVLICEATYYAGWTEFEEQHFATAPIVLDGAFPIDAYEWTFLQPVCRAHCDLIQAQRIEASGSLGAERFGLQVSEAKQLYDIEREKLPKNAFISPPYSLGSED